MRDLMIGDAVAFALNSRLVNGVIESFGADNDAVYIEYNGAVQCRPRTELLLRDTQTGELAKYMQRIEDDPSELSGLSGEELSAAVLVISQLETTCSVLTVKMALLSVLLQDDPDVPEPMFRSTLRASLLSEVFCSLGEIGATGLSLLSVMKLPEDVLLLKWRQFNSTRSEFIAEASKVIKHAKDDAK